MKTWRRILGATVLECLEYYRLNRGAANRAALVGEDCPWDKTADLRKIGSAWKKRPDCDGLEASAGRFWFSRKHGKAVVVDVLDDEIKEVVRED